MKILILTNGEYGDYAFCENTEVYDCIVCADNGLKHAKRLQLKPDYIVGDLDSCSKEDWLYYKEQGVHVDVYPSQKNETDTEIAVEKAIALGGTEIDIWGGLGSRFDHTLANVHLLLGALRRGVKLRLCNPQNTVQLMDKKLRIQGKKGDILSLLPLTPLVRGVYTTNLAYAVCGGSFEIGKPYGVSNVFLEEWVEVSIEEGLLLVIQVRDE
ncbi:thiamine diphosphokinase [Sporanaerobium hydrogeniformans]|uniref:thiamine diphosphokinase n=1 Tax=Sporanaerobium hydrogeniformans TaxID=3072179 RepID=UPI0015D52295|nr:thiamine diphosphokinase [Sporanaerobium hydrogeniformans]